MSDVLCSLCAAAVPTFEAFPHELGPICDICEQERSTTERRVYFTLGAAVSWPILAGCCVGLTCLAGAFTKNGELLAAAFLLVLLGLSALVVAAASATVSGAVRLNVPGNYPIGWIACGLWGGLGIAVGGLFSVFSLAAVVASLLGGG